jgi:hypothetical protein
MSRFYICYTILSVGLSNEFHIPTHHVLEDALSKYFPTWQKFFAKYEGYSLGFFVSKKRGTEGLKVLGPSISRKMKVVDFSIFLPDEVKDMNEYVDLVFSGISSALAKYDVSKEELERIRDECKNELGIGAI